MNHLTHNSRPFILSRQRGGKVELVDPRTTELLVVDEKDVDFSTLRPVYLDVVPNLQHFPARPPSFLSELRAKREAYLKEVRNKKRRKVEKSPKQPKEGKTRRAGKKANTSLNNTISTLSPEMQALFRKALT